MSQQESAIRSWRVKEEFNTRSEKDSGNHSSKMGINIALNSWVSKDANKDRENGIIRTARAKAHLGKSPGPLRIRKNQRNKIRGKLGVETNSKTRRNKEVKDLEDNKNEYFASTYLKYLDRNRLATNVVKRILSLAEHLYAVAGKEVEEEKGVWPRLRRFQTLKKTLGSFQAAFLTAL